MKKTTQDEVRLLRDAASAHAASGHRKEAAACYERLVLLEPTSGDWARRAADCYGELGRERDQRKFLLLALRAYGATGQMLKAIAMGKLAHRIFPGDTEVTRELELLESAPVPRPVPLMQTPAAPIRLRPPGPPAAAPATLDLVPPAAPPPPPRRRSVRPPPLAPASIRPDSEPPPRSILPDMASLSSIAVLVAGAPSDPPGVISLDTDDILIDDWEPVPSVDLESVRPSPASLGRRRSEKAMGALAGARLFADLEADQRNRLVESVEVTTLSAGQVLFEQGDPADAMYVVVEGEVTARVVLPAPVGTLDLAVLGPGEFFGEIGLLGDQPRQASIVAKTEVTLLVFGREAMTGLVDSDERFRFSILRFVRERLVETFMLTSPIFQPFGQDDRESLKRLFRFVEIAEGTTMLEEGRKADGMYVLVAGEAAVRHRGYGEDMLLGLLAPGDVFGEMSLLYQKPAMASVIARTRCYALRLPDRYFMEVVMTHPLLLEHVATLGVTRAEQNAALLAPGPPSSVEDEHVLLF